MHDTTNNHGNSSDTNSRQCAAILAELQTGKSISTIDARERLGIPHPAGRISELRRQGHAIITHLVTVADVSGVFHRVALYVLRREAA